MWFGTKVKKDGYCVSEMHRLLIYFCVFHNLWYSHIGLRGGIRTIAKPWVPVSLFQLLYSLIMYLRFAESQLLLRRVSSLSGKKRASCTEAWGYSGFNTRSKCFLRRGETLQWNAQSDQGVGVWTSVTAVPVACASLSELAWVPRLVRQFHRSLTLN